MALHRRESWVNSGSELVDDPDQQRVIRAPPDGFLLVAAPPGAGKTAVACARIAWLARQGLPPASILMISFTRVAVAEFRDRVERMAADVPDIRGVEITTLDSQAWRILKGLADDKRVEELFGSYDANIETTTAKIAGGDPAVNEWIQHFRHIIVDEAQDLIGPRAELVAAILKARIPGAGATIFADEAQAIYGFTSDEDEDSKSVESFLGLLARHGLQPQRLELRTIHRTRNPGLKSLFLESRKPLVGSVAEPKQAYTGARSCIVDLADENAADFDALVETLGGAEQLVLFRTRAQVLMAASLLHHKHSVSCRLRMSGLPQVIEPWIGLLLSDFTGSILTEDEFLRRWEQRASSPCLGQHGRSPTEAWQVLQRLAFGRRGTVDVGRLRVALSRPRAPIEVAVADVGVGGPILGTIHASKGREAKDVVLMLPRENSKASDKVDHLEEGRVLYVGATRARETLATGSSFSCHSSRTKSGRVFHISKHSPQVEFGREGDLDPASPVMRSLQRDEDECQRMQEWIAEKAESEVDIEAFCVGGGDWNYRIFVDPAKRIACMTPQVNADLFEIATLMRKGRIKPPDTLKHLWCAGASTVCLHPDSTRLEELHEPYSRSGMFLAPVIRGFTMVYFSQISHRSKDW
jgi:hypothetical protein